jgi:phage gpG-like protein
MIRIEIKLPTGIPKKLKAMGEGVQNRVAVGVNRATTRLTNEIKLNLSKGGSAPRKGKNPGKHLRVQSGDLRSSWIARPATVVSGVVEGRVTTSTKYAAIHEYGGTIPMHPRTFLRGGTRRVSTVVNGRRQVVTRNFGRITRGRTTGWSVRIPARPYVDPAIKKSSKLMATDISGEFVRPLK